MNKTLKNILIFIFSTIIYFIFSYPLRDTFAVFTVTDVRPGAALNPFLSICFGPAASLGVSMANFIGDYLSNYPLPVLIQGIPLQFIYGYIPYLVWKKVTKGDEHSYRIDNANKYLKFVLIALIFGALSSIGVAYLVYTNFGANFFETIGFVFMNNFSFTILFGFPLMIGANIVISGIGKERNRKLSISEIIIIYSSIVEFLGIAIITYSVYSRYSGVAPSTYDVWNNIFFYSVIYVNLILIATIIILKIIEKKEKNKN